MEQSQIITDLIHGGGMEGLLWIHQKKNFSLKPDQRDAPWDPCLRHWDAAHILTLAEPLPGDASIVTKGKKPPCRSESCHLEEWRRKAASGLSFRVRPMRLRSANSFQAANMCSSLAAFGCWKNGDRWRRSGHLPPGADVLGGWRWAIDHKLMTKITTQTWVLS